MYGPENEFGEAHDSPISERRRTRSVLLALMENSEINKAWPPKRLAQEVWALCGELRQEYQTFDEFWVIRSRTFRKIRSGEIEGYDYGLIYCALKLFLQKHFPKSLTSPQPRGDGNALHLRTYGADILSDQPFSVGLQDSLRQFNAELNYLTVEQMRALESATKHRHLWIQGAAGTGKTIFAIEAAYRSLRAGLSVLIIYRSRQFEQVFANLLKNVGRQLSLLLHLDFMYLLRQQEMHGIDSDEFRITACELLPGVALDNKPLFDLIIVDDCGTYETQMPFLLKHAENLAHRKIVLAAPEQILDNIIFNFASDRESRTDEIYDIVSQALTPPENYASVALNRNIRNAGNIVEYTNAQCKLNYQNGVMEKGQVGTIRSSWDELDKKLLTLCTEMLARFPPERIKILIDPNIAYPDLELMTPEDYEESHESLLEQMPALTRAILRASQNGHFLHSTFECEEDQIAELITKIADRKTCFIYTDGENLGALTEQSLEDIPRADDFLMELDQWSSPHIDAKTVLSSDALRDPLQLANAILIYPVPLFIGLESDVVIYIRNQTDSFEKQLSRNPDLCEKLKKARSAHHFLAMSRAKYYLIDVVIE